VYQCAIEYTGNGNAGQQARLNDITVEGNITSISKVLADFTEISNALSMALDSEGITWSNIIITMTNSGNIAANTGSILVYVTIFYPSIELINMTLGMSVNGTNESILMEKIPTA